MQNGGTCAPITDYSSYANRLLSVTTVSTNKTHMDRAQIVFQAVQTH